MDTSILTFLIGLVLCSCVYCRSTAENIVEKSETDDLHFLQHVDVHVITKRSAIKDIQQDYPKVYGHTHKASEPLDPSKPKSDVEGPLSIFEGFDTINTIYEPIVEEGDPKNEETKTERRYSNPQEYTAFERSAAEQAEQLEEQQTDDVHSDVKEDEDTRREEPSVRVQNDVDTTSYGAQRPYPQTSSTEEEYRRSQTYPSAYDDSGVERQSTSYRTVIRGGGPSHGGSDTRRQTQTRFEAYRTADEFTPNENIRTYYPSQSGTQYASSDRTQYGTRTYTQTGSGYPSGGEVRGVPYNGPIYVDNNGHYIDAQGRHLDSTGRYYDNSGRYTDAVVTHTVTYPTSGGGSGTRYVPTSGGGQTSYVSGGGDSGSGPGRLVDAGDRPVSSYGGTQFYSSGSTFQNTYTPLTSQISSDPNCPVTNTHVTINGLSCRDAVSQLGNFVCYNYERVSEDCCRQCLQVKRAENAGCEYGDRSVQCRTIQPHDCYNARNRQICCERCDQFRRQMASLGRPGCEYLDQSPRCESIRQRPYLCYHPENNRTCCSSCPRMASRNAPSCPWGDQNPVLCEPFDASQRLQINCYEPLLQTQCCSTCSSLRERMRDNVPGCEYGDYPVLFTNGRQQFTCAEYIRHYRNEDHCAVPDFARKCCYTCFRYRQARG